MQVNAKGKSGSASVESPGPDAQEVSFEPSGHLWQVWGFDSECDFASPTICRGFSFALGRGVSFFGGIQHSPVDGCSAASCNLGVLEGKMSTRPSTPPDGEALYSQLLVLFLLTV